MADRTVLFACLTVALTSSPMARADGDIDHGRELSQTYCARCHVVGDYNRHGGIESTPSFQALVNWRPDYEARFLTFFARPPHPVYVRVPGIPAPKNVPPTATEFRITEQDIADILAFAETLKTD